MIKNLLILLILSMPLSTVTLAGWGEEKEQ